MAVEQSSRTGTVAAPVPQPFATCPSCHTASRTLTEDAVARGADWSCARCHQNWDAVRLKTAAAYARWDQGLQSAVNPR